MFNSAEFGLTHSPFFLPPAFQKKEKRKIKNHGKKKFKKRKKLG